MMRPGRFTLALALGAGLAVATPAAALGAGFPASSTEGFTMTRTGLKAGMYARVQKLEDRYGVHPVSIWTAIQNATPPHVTRALDVLPAPDVVAGFRWNPEDDADSVWTPQGITSSGDSAAAGAVDGHKELIVSWHSTDNVIGTRVTFVDADHDLAGAKYQHVLLVKPDASGNIARVKSHAGGIAWYDHYLYVAESEGGLRVFDMDHIIPVPAANKDETNPYDYVLPQVGMYHINPNLPRPLSFSFVSLDRSTDPPALVTGEYRRDEVGRRLVRWPIKTDTSLLGRTVDASAAYTAPVARVQGALMLGGRIAVSASNGKKMKGGFTSGVPGAATSTTSEWAVGAEDLSYDPGTGRIYSLGEHSAERTVFAVHAFDLGWDVENNFPQLR